MVNRILVVEDEEAPRTLVADALEGAGYEVVAVTDGREGLRAFFAHQPSLVVMDIMMPTMDGWDLLGRIREVSQTPVIILSALGREPDLVRGLRCGADDYVVKPARMAELVARVEVALRKVPVPGTGEETYSDATLRIDLQRHAVHVRGEPVELTPQEFRLLAALVQNAGIVLSSDRLSDLCWGIGAGGAETVRVYIGHVRKKLGDDPRQPQLIETVREFGYRYCTPRSLDTPKGRG